MTPASSLIERRRSTAAEFHARPIPDPAAAAIWIHEVTAPALVLGSTQRNDVADVAACRAAGVDVVRRRSGGGAVWLAPGEVSWIDVIIPAGHPGWSEDVHRPMVWLGRLLAQAFTALGVGAPGVVVHEGAMRSTEHSRLVCFDGLGPGELTLRGAKLVGMSQRRTRAAARLQCCWYSHHDHADLTRLLAGDVTAADLSLVATVPGSASASGAGSGPAPGSAVTADAVAQHLAAALTAGPR